MSEIKKKKKVPSKTEWFPLNLPSLETASPHTWNQEGNRDCGGNLIQDILC